MSAVHLSIILLLLYWNLYFLCFQVEFVKKLIVEAGVVAVPGRGFFHTHSEVSNGNLNYQKRYIRFAFCKSDATLAAVAERFSKILNTRGHLVLN